MTPVQRRIKPSRLKNMNRRDERGRDDNEKRRIEVVEFRGRVASLADSIFEFVLTRKPEAQLRDACSKMDRAETFEGNELQKRSHEDDGK